MKIKLILSVLFVLLGASIAHGAALAEMPIPDSAYIVVSLVNQDPDPAEPGQYVDLRFKFENKGQEAAQDIEVELLLEYPFSLDQGVSAIKNIGSLYGRQKGNEGIIVKYHIRVDKDALDGTNEIKLRYRDKGNAWVTLEAFDIDIQTHELILSVKDVASDPKEISPGETASISILLENIANSIIKDIQVKLDLAGKPFAPIESSNEKSLLYLKPGENSKLIFNLMAEGNTDAGVYQIPLLANYVDELGTKYARNSTIGLVIGSAPDLSVSIDSTDIYKAGMSGSVSIKFVNKGATDIKFLYAKLNDAEGLIIKNNNEVYVGNIDSDDYETAEFSLFVHSKAKENIILPLSIEYRDSNNKEYSKEINLPLRLYSNKESKQLGLQKGNGFVGVIVIIVIVGAGLFFYTRYKKKIKKKA